MVDFEAAASLNHGKEQQGKNDENRFWISGFFVGSSILAGQPSLFTELG